MLLQYAMYSFLFPIVQQKRRAKLLQIFPYVIKVVCLLIIHVFLRIVDSFCINESVILSSAFKCSDKSYQNSSHHVTHKAAYGIISYKCFKLF